MDRPRPMRRACCRAALIALAMCAAWTSTAAASGEALISVELCRDVQAREGVGCGQSFPADVGQVHALLAVRVPPGESGQVQLLWRYGAQLVQRHTLAIKFYRPGGYRTRARQRIGAEFPGAWSIEVLAADGRSLGTTRFTVGEAPDGAAVEAPAVVAQADPPAAIDEDLPEEDPPEDAGGPGDAQVFTLDGGLDDEADAAPAAPPPDAAVAAAPPIAPPEVAPPKAAPPEVASAGAAPPQAAPTETDDGDNRRRGALMLLIGGLLLLVAGVIIARRRSKSAATVPPAAAPRPATAPPPAAPAEPAPVEVAPVSLEAATDALQRLTDLVTQLWSRWVAATSGSPQRALNAAWRSVSDPGRLGLDHIRLCNALESAAKVYSTIPPRGTSADILRLRLYAQAPALLGVVCALSVECERLGFDGVRLEHAFSPWGGRAGLTAELLSILDDGAAALGTTRMAVVPYETKATAASRDYDVELRPFPVPAPLADRLAAGNRVVRVETPPFAGAGTLVVWGVTPQ